MNKEWYVTAYTPEVKPKEEWVSLADFMRMKKELEKENRRLREIIKENCPQRVQIMLEADDE